MKEICRFCTHYEPSVKYIGRLGICRITNKAISCTEKCPEYKEGKQVWFETKEGVKDNGQH